MPNTPIGVVPSPSDLLALSPLCPTEPVHGPAASDQQVPDRCHSVTVAVVDPVDAATTVTSWAPPPVDAIGAGREDEHEVGAAVVGGARRVVVVFKTTFVVV